MVYIKTWHRRQALAFAKDFPENREDALAILEALRELTEAFLYDAEEVSEADQADRASATIVRLAPRSETSQT